MGGANERKVTRQQAKYVATMKEYKKKESNMIKTLLGALLFILSIRTVVAEQNNYLWVEYDPSVASIPDKIQKNCGALNVTDKSLKFYKPDFPIEGFKAETSGYAVFDFQIDETGSTKNIEFIAASEKAKSGFKRNSISALKKVKFDITEEWLQSCKDQKYRIGYAYHLMSSCTAKEFPKPIINVCIIGEMVKIRQ